MLKLYFAPRTRATRARWLLEEAGAPHELVPVDLAAGENRTPAYRALHPLGKVPVLSDGEVTIYETAAILATIADRFPEARLAPPVSSPQRALYYQWIAFAVGEMEAPIGAVMRHSARLPEAQRLPAAAAEGRARFDAVAAALESALAGRDYLLGEFSAADVMVGGHLIWARKYGLLEGRPVLEAYCARLSARPAYRRANQEIGTSIGGCSSERR